MEKFSLSFSAIGTKWVIDCFQSFSEKKEVEKVIKYRIEEFDKTYSRFRRDSLVWSISKKEGVWEFPKDSKKLFNFYEKLYKLTEGKFTPLIGNTLIQAGYDEKYSLIPGELKPVPEIKQVYSFNYPNLTIKKPFMLDFGALGKGYLIDIISGLLKEQNVKSFCIDAGGDIFCHNLKKSARIGLENPINLKQVIGVVEINNMSICSSAGNRRRWGNYHHIMDPVTLSSSNKILSTWVLAKDTITADGLATALFLTEPEKLISHFNFEFLILYPDFKIKRTKGFKAELFLKDR
jgi:FAD:protein FMN transferase